MLLKFFFLFCCIANIIFFQPAESVTINEKSSEGACFTANDLFLSNAVKVAFINLNVLAPSGTEKTNLSGEGKLIKSNIDLLDSLRKEKYNIFILNGDETVTSERTNIGFGLPSSESKSAKLKKMLKKSTDFSTAKECNINGLPAQKIPERVYSISTNDWYNNQKDTLVSVDRSDQFKRTTEFCNERGVLRQKLCEQQLSVKHVLNSIFLITGKKQGVKVIFLNDSMSFMSYAFDLENKNRKDKLSIEVTYVHFLGTKENVSANKKAAAYTEQGVAFTKGFRKSFAGIKSNLQRHVCQITTKKKITKKYVMFC